MTPEEARAVAADLLRQAGDEQGARVLERAQVILERLHPWRFQLVYEAAKLQSEFDLFAYLDPAWAAAEVERAHGEALEMHENWKRLERLRDDAVDAMRYSMMPTGWWTP